MVIILVLGSLHLEPFYWDLLLFLINHLDGFSIFCFVSLAVFECIQYTYNVVLNKRVGWSIKLFFRVKKVVGVVVVYLAVVIKVVDHECHQQLFLLGLVKKVLQAWNVFFKSKLLRKFENAENFACYLVRIAVFQKISDARPVDFNSYIQFGACRQVAEAPKKIYQFRIILSQVLRFLVVDSLDNFVYLLRIHPLDIIFVCDRGGLPSKKSDDWRL